MRRSVRLLLVLTGLSVLYLLAFPVPAGTELVVQRAWGLSVASAPATLPETAAPGPDDPPIAVRTNDSFAFIHSDGSIQYRAPVAHEVELATYGFVVYGRAPEQLVLQDTAGAFVTTIPRAGYPVLTDDRVYVRGGRDSVLSAYSVAGTGLWEQELNGFIASIRSDGDLTLVGLLAGGIAVIDASGSTLPLEGTSQSHEISVYGSAIDSATGTVAVIYGPSDPALVLYDHRADRLVPTLRVELHAVPGGAVPVEITRDGRFVIFRDRGIRVVRISSGADVEIPFGPVVRQIDTQIGGGMIGALGLGDDPDPQRGFRRSAEVTIFDRDGHTPVRVPFAADRVSLQSVGGQSYLVLDNRVLSFTVSEE